MEPTGVILAAIDCDADAIEEWNRWYDLEHTPMNVCLDGVQLSRRYVAPPALHAARVTASDSPYAGGRCTFITTYVVTGEPMAAFEAMSDEVPNLYAGGRMRFSPDRRAVREGAIYAGRSAHGRAELQLAPRDVPFVAHTGLVLIQRRGGDDRAARMAELDGVLGVWSLASLAESDRFLDLVFVEDDPARRALAIREAVPHEAEVLVDAPFQLIDPLRYPWAEEIRSSDLPKTVA